MNIREKFIDAIYKRISINTPEGIISILENPPGRKPKENIIELSNYFKNKSETDKIMIEKIIKLSINSAIFDILCFLDQTAKLDDDIDDIKVLVYDKNKEILLNDMNEEYLHDLFNIKVGNV